MAAYLPALPRDEVRDRGASEQSRAKIYTPGELKATAHYNSEAQAAFDRAAQLGQMYRQRWFRQLGFWDRFRLFSNSPANRRLLAVAKGLYQTEPAFRALWDTVKGSPPDIEHVGWLRLWIR